MENSFDKNISFVSEGIECNRVFKKFNGDVNISVIIICKDEEKYIDKCIDSVLLDKKCGDEVIIVDTGSKDKTIDIIKKYGTRVSFFQETWNENFSEIRNKSMLYSNNKWIFFIDADEILCRNGLNNLRYVLSRINDKEKIAICPSIVDVENNHIINGVRRIFNKDNNINFFGYVHEEPRIEGEAIEYISLSNLRLMHYGYIKENLNGKNKIIRNLDLLKKNLKEEPNNPRWIYFYARDGKGYIDDREYIENLKKVVDISNVSNKYFYYKVRSLSDLVNYYFVKSEVKKAKVYLKCLKSTLPSLSDVKYFESIIKFIELKKRISCILNDLISYRKEKKDIEYGSIHSSYFHIDYLLALLLFDIGEYQKSMDFFKKLEKNNFFSIKDKFEVLFEELNKLLN